jgi:hypothetical protein
MYPEYASFDSELVIHHAIPPSITNKYPDLFTEAELNSLVNLRGICRLDQESVHLPIMHGWIDFLYSHKQTTRKDILDEAARVDRIWGSKFYPAIGKTALSNKL